LKLLKVDFEFVVEFDFDVVEEFDVEVNVDIEINGCVFYALNVRCN
jgi:hypothetical protein